MGTDVREGGRMTGHPSSSRLSRGDRSDHR